MCVCKYTCELVHVCMHACVGGSYTQRLEVQEPSRAGIIGSCEHLTLVLITSPLEERCFPLPTKPLSLLLINRLFELYFQIQQKCRNQTRWPMPEIAVPGRLRQKDHMRPPWTIIWVHYCVCIARPCLKGGKGFPNCSHKSHWRISTLTSKSKQSLRDVSWADCQHK